MGPRTAAEQYLKRHPGAKRFQVTLYGSLAATGKGHLTDWAIYNVLGKDRTEFIWHPEIVLPFHPNGMKYAVVDDNGQLHDEWTVYSIGGGALAEEGANTLETPDLYELDHLEDIKQWCEYRGKSYWEYVEECEGPDIWEYLR